MMTAKMGEHDMGTHRAGRGSSRGRQGGRPKKLDSAKKVAMAQALYDQGTHSISDICQMLGISRATLYRSIQARDPND